jgi:hypothetical protein
MTNKGKQKEAKSRKKKQIVAKRSNPVLLHFASICFYLLLIAFWSSRRRH